jgi:hypothetical protein
VKVTRVETFHFFITKRPGGELYIQIKIVGGLGEDIVFFFFIEIDV